MQHSVMIQLILLMPVFLSSGIELSSKASIVDPVDFISNYDPDGFTKKTSSLFIGRNNTEIWAHAGSNVVFDCLVGRPDLKKHAPIMWSRNSPFTLISIGGERHSKDPRFWVEEPDVNNTSKQSWNWGLAIRRVRLDDKGTYTCQTSSHPPQYLLTVLHTVEAKAVIEGPDEKYIKAGSSLKLVCRFENVTQHPETVFWYLNQRMISYDEAFHVEPLMSPDNGLGLKWPVGTILSVSKTNSISHDGNYTCAPSTGVISDSVLVHIIDDGKIPPAAVYGDSSKAAGLKINTTHYFPGVLLYVMSQLLSTLLSSNAEI